LRYNRYYRQPAALGRPAGRPVVLHGQTQTEHRRAWTGIVGATHAGRRYRISQTDNVANYRSIKRRRTTPPDFYANILILWNEFLPRGETINLEKKPRGKNLLPPPFFSQPFNQPTASALEDYVRSIP